MIRGPYGGTVSGGGNVTAGEAQEKGRWLMKGVGRRKEKMWMKKTNHRSSPEERGQKTPVKGPEEVTVWVEDTSE